jgi:hypothetical protein
VIHSSNFIVIILDISNFTCFVLGPYQWKLCLLDNRGYRLNENIVKHNIDETKHSVQFSSLEYAKEYKVCASVTGANRYLNCDAALQKESRFTCKDIKTECVPLPNASKKPIQVAWNPKEDFDPFTSIKVMMEEGTFDGSKSGLSKFSIR